jgi:uncharacterized protein (TIGR02594 family)
MADVPGWLAEMRLITGLSEKPGTPDEPKIMAMASFIGDEFPDMASYCAQYVHDSIPWCGLAEAYCMARVGIRPPFGKTDTDKFLWARAWADDPDYTKLPIPKLGCVVVLTRSGGGHVTTYESDAGSNIKCRGGNQSDAVTVASYPKSSVIAYVWPKYSAYPPSPEPEPEPIPEALPLLRKGDKGPSVAYMQSLIPKWIDGDFGTTTESLLKEFQRSKNLIVDGICGPDTWTALGAVPPPESTPAPEPAGEWQTSVMATMFGGSSEHEPSAYPPYDAISPQELSVALPYRFKGTRPMVEVRTVSGVSMVAEIRDIGPWMIDDNYWEKKTRPIAETCFKNKMPLPSGPQKGKVPTNPAGIDLSEYLAKTLNLGGKGVVDWRLVKP